MSDLEKEHIKHLTKEDHRRAYMAGYEMAQQHERIQPMLGEDEGFEEWYEREVANPPDHWGS